MVHNIKRKIDLLLDPSAKEGRLHDSIRNFLIGLIVLNTIAVTIETVNSIYLEHKRFFDLFDELSVFVFSVEYILRVWACTSKEKYSHPVTGRIKYMFSAVALIDLLAILPYYIPFFILVDLRFLRILRLIRLLRVFKLGRYIQASKLLMNVFRSRKEELLMGFLMTFFLTIIASGIMYFVEHNAQPEKFSSIPATMWWSVNTLTTVGYGDIYPITPLGRVLGSIISVLGIGLFALPAGIFASGFSEEIRKMKKEKKYCPHCHHELNESS